MNEVAQYSSMNVIYFLFKLPFDLLPLECRRHSAISKMYYWYIVSGRVAFSFFFKSNDILVD